MVVPILDEALRALECYYGHRAFRPLQGAVVRAVLTGRDVLAVLPTGAGKSLCYQLPALLLPGLTVVVSPLISLMEDQIGRLTRQGIPAAADCGSTPTGVRRSLGRRLGDGSLRLLYAAPERLVSTGFRTLLRDASVTRLAVDEAHCVSEWGHDFRPAYREILAFRRSVGDPPLLALTATATPATRADLIASLGLRDPRLIIGRSNRANLHWSVHRVTRLEEGLRAVWRALRTGRGAAIVYLPTRRRAARVATSLRRLGLRVGAYHAGLGAASRRAVQEQFLAGGLQAVCATSAFGMGIDHGSIRAVFHLGLPRSLEGYVQEAGRAGRDGRPAGCVLYHERGEGRIRRRIIGADRTLSAEGRRRALHRLSAVRRYVTTRRCRRAVIADYFGEPSPRCTGCDRCDSRGLREAPAPSR